MSQRKHRLFRLFITLSLGIAIPGQAHAQRPVELAPNAPQDKPAGVTDCQLKDFLRATAPYIEKAKASLPRAIARFQAGLPRGETFFITARLTDSQGRFEQAFVAVDSIVGRRIVGRIWNEITVVSGYRLGQRYELADSSVVDWTISKPDGSEEGNEVGKFLDTYQPPASCARTS